jgi:diacylglycerol kinase (ATP)
MTAPINAIDDDVVRASECLIVVNPAAAGVDAAAVRHVAEWIAPRAGRVRTVWTQRPGHATELARANPDAALLLALGGDGTINELIQGLGDDARRRPTICALPLGSGNSTARNLFGDRDWRQVLELLDSPGACRIRDLDLLRLREPGVTAVLGVATGFLAQVLLGARAVDARLRGIDRYYAAAADVLGTMPSHPTRVTVDGVVLVEGATSSVAVGGGRFRARTFQFLPESLLDDGLLDVSTIAALDASAVAELVPLMPTGAQLGRSEVHYARGRTVVIERTDGRPLVAEFDGSVWDDAGPRLTVDIVPSGLRAIGASDCPCG